MSETLANSSARLSQNAQPELIEKRCTKCNALLLKLVMGELEVKCDKCKTMNKIKVVLQSQYA